MIRFVTDGRDGKVVGLGLTEGNLQLIERDEPIVFELAEDGVAPGTFVIGIEGSVLASRLVDESQSGPGTLLSLSASDIAQLRETAMLQRELGRYEGSATQAVVIYGDTEVHILMALRESGLLPDGTEIEGWPQYVRDVERDGVFGQRGVVPPQGSWVHIGPPSDESPAVGDAERPSWWERLIRSPLAWLLAIFALAGLVTGLVQALRAGGRVAAKPEVQRPETPMPPSEPQRRRWVDEGGDRIFGARAGERRCPVSVWVPAPLGERPVASRPPRATSDSTQRLQDALAWMFDERLMDIAPAPGHDVHSLRRVIRNPPPSDGWRGVRTYATLVVSELSDATILGPVGDATVDEEPVVLGTRTTTTQSLALAPGHVRARLVVWDYVAEAVVCASEEVEVQTPPLHLSSFRSDATATSEDGVLKARVETLIAAAVAARAQLRSVATDDAAPVGTPL